MAARLNSSPDRHSKASDFLDVGLVRDFDLPSNTGYPPRARSRHLAESCIPAFVLVNNVYRGSGITDPFNNVPFGIDQSPGLTTRSLKPIRDKTGMTDLALKWHEKLLIVIEVFIRTNLVIVLHMAGHVLVGIEVIIQVPCKVLPPNH